MKLRNKKTGKVFDALIREKGGGGSYSLIVCDIKAYEQSKSILDATHFVLGEYDSLAKLYEDWEDVDGTNDTNMPLIKDEKIRKAVRAWAEANDIEDGITYLGDGEFRSYLNTTIDFAILVDEHRFDLLKKSEEYTIAELCGEEEK